MGAAQCRCSSENGSGRFAAERLEELQDEALHVVDHDNEGSNAGCELQEERGNCERGNSDSYEEQKEKEIKPPPPPIQRAAFDPMLTRGHSTLVTATASPEDKDEAPHPMAQQPRRLASLPDLTGNVAPLERLQRSGDQVRAVVRLHRILRAGPALDAGPVKCAISLEMLNQFSERAREAMGAEYGQASVRAVCSAIIRPTCEQSGKAYARMLNGDVPLAAQVFVCHAWDENFAEFVASINHTFRHWPRKPNLWVCTFALMQTKRHTSVKRPQDAPFAAALKAANAILVVRNRQVDVYSRLWPVWEIYLAKKMGLLDKRGGLLVAGPDVFPDAAVDVSRAETSHAEDREALNQAILEEEGGYAEVGRAVADVKASGHRNPVS